jgi:hypothetical protein
VSPVYRAGDRGELPVVRMGRRGAIRNPRQRARAGKAVVKIGHRGGCPPPSSRGERERGLEQLDVAAFARGSSSWWARKPAVAACSVLVERAQSAACCKSKRILCHQTDSGPKTPSGMSSGAGSAIRGPGRSPPKGDGSPLSSRKASRVARKAIGARRLDGGFPERSGRGSGRTSRCHLCEATARGGRTF